MTDLDLEVLCQRRFCGHPAADHDGGVGPCRRWENHQEGTACPEFLPESGPLSEPRTGAESSYLSKVVGRALLAFVLVDQLKEPYRIVADAVEFQRGADLRELLTAIEDAGTQGALDPDRLETQRLVDLATRLRKEYP